MFKTICTPRPITQHNFIFLNLFIDQLFYESQILQFPRNTKDVKDTYFRETI